MNKFYISLLLFIFSYLSNAASFSAFIEGNNLYVTILSHSCQHESPILDVSPTCLDDRKTKNLVHLCRAQLETNEQCQESEKIARVHVFNLREHKVAREARKLELKFQKEIIVIDIEQK